MTAILVSLLGCVHAAAPEPIAPVAPAPSPAPEGRRVALVVGNGGYQHTTPLQQPPKDAALIAGALRDLGFEVVVGEDLSQQAFSKAVADFKQLLSGSDVAFFYYAGQGLQYNGFHYMAPVDTKIESPEYIDVNAIAVEKVIEAMGGSNRALNVVVFDSSLRNPWASQWVNGTRDIGPGYQYVYVPPGFLFSTPVPSGAIADDTGRYAAALAAQLKTPCTSLVDAFVRVYDEVYEATDGKQQPEVTLRAGKAALELQLAGCR